jgi:hypothetical protein
MTMSQSIPAGERVQVCMCRAHLRASRVAALSTAGGGIDESFTIYLGAQLKSMHNVRITMAERRSHVDNTQQQGAAVPAWRLHMAMTLYTRQLHARLILVPSTNPLYHVLEKTGKSHSRIAFITLQILLVNVNRAPSCIFHHSMNSCRRWQNW